MGCEAREEALRLTLGGSRGATLDLLEEVLLQHSPYLSAARWLPPRPPERALRWIEDRDEDHVFAVEGEAWRALVALVRLDRTARRAQALLIPVPAGPRAWPGLETAARSLLELAFARQGLRRCEWHLPSAWIRARELAARLGFRQEAVLPAAYRGRDASCDLEIHGLLDGEWQRAA